MNDAKFDRVLATTALVISIYFCCGNHSHKTYKKRRYPMKGFRIFYRPAKAEIIGTTMEMTKAAIAIIRVTLLSIISSCVFLHSITAVRLARLSYATKRVIYGCV